MTHTGPVYASGEVWYGETPEDGQLAKFYGDPELAERAARAVNRDALFDECVEALEAISKLSAGGPHISAKDGLFAATDALAKGRSIARALLTRIKEITG